MLEAAAPIIELRAVTRRFTSDRKDVAALRDISLGIKQGEFVSIVGPSGCGKSTILNIIVGLLAPSSGERLYKGRAFAGVNREIGYVTQADNLFPWRTVLGNVEFGLAMRAMGTPRERRRRAYELLDRVGLGGFADHFRHELSGGMRQRVNIVRTLAYDPAVILLDEPFGPLDAQTRLQLQEVLLRLWQERAGTTVVFITHDLAEAIALADRVVVMSARPGRILEVMPVDLPRPRDVYTIAVDPRFRALYDRLWDRLADEMRAPA